MEGIISHKPAYPAPIKAVFANINQGLFGLKVHQVVVTAITTKSIASISTFGFPIFSDNLLNRGINIKLNAIYMMVPYPANFAPSFQSPPKT